MRDKPQISARQLAARMIGRVIEDGNLMAELTLRDDFMGLPAPERARAQRLASETLRGLEKVDRILGKFLTKTPPDPVLNILRIATYELCTGEAAHGVVNDAVNSTARNRKFSKMKGLVNAILRKVASVGVQQWSLLRPSRLPKWLREPLKLAYGNEVVGQIEQVQSQIPPVDITLKETARAEEFAKLMNGKIIFPGTLRLQNPGQISMLPGYKEGAWWVQDVASAFAVRLLGDVSGKSALDLCAAPGGKTLQLSAAGANVNAVDLSKTRLKRLNENLSRTQLSAKVQCKDAFEVQDDAFDIVLLDAPCSATGTMRRHPDLPFARNGDDFENLFTLQKRMLEHASARVGPHGVLLYCTCSLLPDEGEAQIDTFLRRHPEFECDTSMFDHPNLLEDWCEKGIGLRLRPDYFENSGGMDGFFISILRKK